MNLEKNFNPGAYPDRPDSRDYKYKYTVFGTPIIDWEKGFDIEKNLGITLVVENQNGSSSCVGQAWAKYAEVLNYVETGELVNHSSKSIYEQIYLPGGGAYIRDGGKAIVDGGISLEKTLPSYEGMNNDTPPSEEYMTNQTIDDEIRKEMLVYQAKEYRSINTLNADLIAYSIKSNYGAVSGALGDNIGWKDWIVKPPTSSNPWGHAIYFIAFGQDERGKWFDFINSWGNSWGSNGRGRMYFDEYAMPINTFGIWTLIDKPNLEEDMLIVTTNDKPAIYLIRMNKRIMIVDMPTLEALKEKFKIISDEEMSTYEDGGTLIWTDRIIN